MTRLGEAMSILARSTCSPSANSPARMRRNRYRVLFHAAVAAGALLAGTGQGAAVLADLVGAQVVHIGLALEDELLGVFVELVEIVGRVEFAVVPFTAQPLHVLADGIHVFGVFLDGVGVVEAQVAHAAELARPRRSSGRWTWHGPDAGNRWVPEESACAPDPRNDPTRCRP